MSSPAAQRLHVAGQGADFGRAGVGALDGRHSFLPHAHPLGHLRLGQSQPGALLGQRPGPVPGGQRGRAEVNLLSVPGEKLVHK